MIDNDFFSVKVIKDTVQKIGGIWFDTGAYNANIIGVRKDRTIASNSFDDYILYIAKTEAGEWFYRKYECTTLPGLTQMVEPDHDSGVAILESNTQYRGAYKLGKHKGQYDALVQQGVGSVTIFRDNTKDSFIHLNPATKETGWFGINIHKAGNDSTFVGDWSAGCQVFKRAADFDSFIKLCKKSAAMWGNSFSYTLIDESKFH